MSSAQDSGARFRGTHAEFTKYAGPRWRNVVQSITRPYKKKVGSCQDCGASRVPLDAAHRNGRSRPVIIDELLGSPNPHDVVDVNLDAFEMSFRQAHNPPEKAILVLCKPCHTKYDNLVRARVHETQASTRSGTVPQGVGIVVDDVLPITLDPPGSKAFLDRLLDVGTATIETVYADGGIASKTWNAHRMTEKSSVLGNLRTRREFRSGVWQAAGIVALRVTAAG